jgi:Cytoplasmic Fragile-X interacting family
MLFDIVPNWTYQSDLKSFVPGVISSVEITHRKQPEKDQHVFLFGTQALSAHHSKLYESASPSIGSSHLLCIVKMLGDAGAMVVMNELTAHLDKLTKHFFEMHTPFMLSKLPVGFELESLDLTAKGTTGI